jgi:hypothetical protein
MGCTKSKLAETFKTLIIDLLEDDDEKADIYILDLIHDKNTYNTESRAEIYRLSELLNEKKKRRAQMADSVHEKLREFEEEA